MLNKLDSFIVQYNINVFKYIPIVYIRYYLYVHMSLNIELNGHNFSINNSNNIATNNNK